MMKYLEQKVLPVVRDIADWLFILMKNIFRLVCMALTYETCVAAYLLAGCAGQVLQDKDGNNLTKSGDECPNPKTTPYCPKTKPNRNSAVLKQSSIGPDQRNLATPS